MKCPYCNEGMVPEHGFAPPHRCQDCAGSGRIVICAGCDRVIPEDAAEDGYCPRCWEEVQAIRRVR